MISIPSLGGRLKLGAGWCNAPSPVLRGAGNESSNGGDIVAPLGNQAATENTNVCLPDDENPAYSPTTFSMVSAKRQRENVVCALLFQHLGRRLRPTWGDKDGEHSSLICLRYAASMGL